MADDISLIIGVDDAPVRRVVQLMDNLEAEVRAVEKAEKRGLVTRKKATIETKRLTDQMSRLREISSGGAKEFYKFEKSLLNSGKAARRNEVAFQQAGYQVQDFIVQVQGGTNPLIAFSQQGSQLAGFFAGPWGAMIGLGIAALSSLAMAFMATGESAKSFEDQIKDTESSLDDYFSLLKSQSGIYDDVFEQNIAALKLTSQTAKDLLAIAKIEAFDSIEGLAKSLADANTEAGFFRKLILGTDIGLVGDLLNINTLLDGNITSWKAARKQVSEFITSVRGISEASDIDTMYQAAIAARDAFKQNVDITGDLTDQQLEFFTQLTQTIQQLEIMGASTKALEASWSDTTMATEASIEALKLYYDLQQKAVDKQKELAKAVKGIEDAVEKTTKTLERENALLEATLKYGKDSKEVQELKAQQAREEFIEQQKSNKVLGNNLDKALEIYDANAALKVELQASEDSAKGLADALKEASSAMSSLEKFSEGLDKALAVSIAKVKALKSGADATIAGSIAAMRLDLSNKMQAAKESGVDAGIIERMYGGERDEISRLEASEKERKRLEAANRASGKKEKNVVNINEIIAARKEQIAQDRVLLGLKGEEQESARIYYDLLEKNKDADIKTTEAKLEGAAKELAAREQQNRVLEEAVQKQEDIANTIADSFGDAFMSIVDGTQSAKDAFSDMARHIIARLYEILVIEQMVQSIAGAITGSFGGGGGAPTTSPRPPAMPARASGGTVMSNQPYLVGEKGPELIMPRNMGHVMNADLTSKAMGEGSGAVNIVQNFSFSANGDESVKKIIAQAAPQIANMTQKQIMDSRRRGGSMKATFG